MIDFLILMVMIAIFVSFISFIKDTSLVNRVVAFDTMSIISISLLVLLSISEKEPFYIDIAFVFALIGFIGIVVFARFNQLKKGRTTDA